MTESLQLLLAIEIVIFFTILYYRWARTKSKAQKTGIILIGHKDECVRKNADGRKINS